MLKSGLYIVSTPIGNLEDISARALKVLEQAEYIACEDTRVTQKLFKLLNLPTDKPFICYQNYNETQKAQDLIDIISSSKSVALVSDAGSPLISDPGFKLVKLCRKQNVPVYVVPGACALIAALQLSGLPTNRFMFAGFIPNKDKSRADLFQDLKGIKSTLVFYETSIRLTKTLKAAADIFKNREMAVAREITKIYEECQTGTAEELLLHYEKTPPKGEIVLMVAPPEEEKTSTIDLNAELQKRLNKMSVKSAVQEVALLSGANKNTVYKMALELKNAKQ